MFFGELTKEMVERAGVRAAYPPVYGVDRSIGLTSEPRYAANDLSKYKTLYRRMFAYNPMRLNIGSIGYCSDDFAPGLVSPDYIVFKCIEDQLDPEYLRWYIRSTQWMQWVQRGGVGSVRHRIYYSELARMPIDIPDIGEQRRIANILNLFELNLTLLNTQYYLLERLARQVFRSWFIDFEPVKVKVAAKEEGRDPEIAAMVALSGKSEADFDALAASTLASLATTVGLFPDELDESAVGQIPRGWSATFLPEVIEINPRRILRKGVAAQYIDMAALPTKGPSITSSIKREFTSGSKFKNGDTLFARITPCLENGKTGYVDLLEEGAVGWGSTEFIVLRPKSPLPPQFGYLLCREEEFRSFAIANMTGTSGRQRVPNDCFASYLIAVPTVGVARAFERIVTPIFGLMHQLSEQSTKLAQTRDLLLPSLLSGEFSTLTVE